MLTLLLLTGLITSFPLSSISPHSEAEIYRLLQKMQALEKGKHGWPLNDILTAEVSFLERILASRKRKKSKKKLEGRNVARPVNNIIPYEVNNIKLITTTTTPSTVSHLDPFVMLKPPDLSQQTVTVYSDNESVKDDIFSDVDEGEDKYAYKRKVNSVKAKVKKYGEFELYNPTTHGLKEVTENIKIHENDGSSSRSPHIFARRPRKIVKKYGAFELYEPTAHVS